MDFEVREKTECDECASCSKSFNCYRGYGEGYCKCVWKTKKVLYVLCYECGTPKTHNNRHLWDEYDLINGEWRNDA